jgi:GTP-binding protein
MFVDKVSLRFIAGKGGDGVIAFRREKYVPKGGPSGGNGGRGGSIILLASDDVNSLDFFRFKKEIKAADGVDGKSKDRYGHYAKDLVLKVPVGTMIFEQETHQLLLDLDEKDKTYIVAKGGRGGRGNASFASSVNRTPKIAENGIPGEDVAVVLELKLIADVCLIGLPNVGKSSLINVMTNAKSLVGDYEFTTLEPVLGVAYTNDTSFVVADIPGIIKGASTGKGLGLKFLRHIERCKVVCFVISVDAQEPLQDFKLLKYELKRYGLKVSKIPMMVALSKCDEPLESSLYQEVKKGIDIPVLPISSLTNYHIKELKDRLALLVQEHPEPIFEIKHQIKTYNLMDDGDVFTIVKEKDNQYRILGDRVLRTYHLINISTDEGLIKLMAYLRKIGVDEKLDQMKLKDGTTVLLGDFEFEYFR